MKHKPLQMKMTPREKSWRAVYDDRGNLLDYGHFGGITKTIHNLLIADTQEELEKDLNRALRNIKIKNWFKSLFDWGS